MNKYVYLHNLTLLQPDKFENQNTLINELLDGVDENEETTKMKKSLTNLTNFGFGTISTCFKDGTETDMVNACLNKLFSIGDIIKDDISHVVHCSPTAIIGEDGGIIGGIGRNVLDLQNIKKATYVPMVGGCASIEPVFEVAISLTRASLKPVLLIFSLHASSARRQITKKNLLESKLRAAPFVLFGDACVACIISPNPSLLTNTYEIMATKFNYTANTWVAKAFLENELTMLLNAETQKNMLKNFLMKELESARKTYNVEYFFVHNQVPIFFLECIDNLKINRNFAPEIVSKYGNLAFLTSIVNLCENESIIKDDGIIGLFSAGEHTGVSESTLILRALKTGTTNREEILSLRKNRSSI